jgi:hypothetical protein
VNRGKAKGGIDGIQKKGPPERDQADLKGGENEID